MIQLNGYRTEVFGATILLLFVWVAYDIAMQLDKHWYKYMDSS